MLTDYTTCDQIRAILGVSEDELSDATIALEVYLSGLSEDLLDISDSLEADYLIVNALVVRIAKEQRLWRTARSFATFSLAKRLGTGLPMFGPKDITDGKASVNRFSDSPYRTTLKNIEEEYGLAKQRLIDAYTAYSASVNTVAPRVYAQVSSPTFDPITGE